MKRISFKELYENIPNTPSPKARFISEVAELTHKKETTIKMWLCNYYAPDELTTQIIAEHFNVEPSTLFPNAKRKK